MTRFWRPLDVRGGGGVGVAEVESAFDEAIERGRPDDGVALDGQEVGPVLVVDQQQDVRPSLGHDVLAPLRRVHAKGVLPDQLVRFLRSLRIHVVLVVSPEPDVGEVAFQFQERHQCVAGRAVVDAQLACSRRSQSILSVASSQAMRSCELKPLW